MSNYIAKVLVTGGQGQLAHALRHHARANEFALTFLSHLECDITAMPSLVNAINQFTPDIIINTAAYTAVDKAESESELANQINHLGASNLAVICHKQKIPLLHLSTDYIFDGTNVSPYCEDDKASPINMYGKTKWLGEVAIREQCEQHFILRVSGVFSEYGNNFLKTMVRLGRERDEMRVVADQTTCPTYAGDIADTLFHLIQAQNHWGTYHYCSQPPTTWHAFATAIIAAAKNKQAMQVKTIQAITTADYPTPAKRPAYSVLDCSKIEKTFGLRSPNWLASIAKSIQSL